ncbi:hypothetical protein D3C73_1276530 [compost metagenome]
MWVVGLIVIAGFYISLGEVLNSSVFDVAFNPLIGVMLLLLCTVALLLIISKYKQRVISIWVILSVVPGGALVLYSYSDPGTGGWITFPWDWLVWDFYIPIIVGIAQIITIGLIKTIFTKSE